MATSIFLAGLAALAAAVLLLGFSSVLALVLAYAVRPPRMRTPTPAPPVSFLARLPSRADRIM